ncbi:MAG: transposase [Actinomycetota bacterium]|nr:transposase [Actinomycetota bacterium]
MGAGGVRGEVERLRVENSRLRGEVEELRRAGKRQAAPFSRGDPKPDPRWSGRKPGEGYGTKARRWIPDHVDEEIEVPLPDGCPCCGGELDLERVADQYQEDIVVPVRAHVRRFGVRVGRCRRCGRRAVGRHPLQTSDALGAAGVQVGPHAVALAAQLNKELGLPVAKVARVLAELCGLQVTAGGLHQALARLAAAAAPTYQALIEGVRNSFAVAADETGWRVCGTRQWLWVFVGDGVTVYLIADGRGYEQACIVLGTGFDGVLERDGWAPYRRFKHASHQTCVAHLLRRCGELIADSVAGQARVPHAVRRLLLDALALRDQHTALLSPDRHDPDVIEGHAVEIDANGDPIDGEPVNTGSSLLAGLAALARRALPAGLTRPAPLAAGHQQPAPAPATNTPDADGTRSLQAGRVNLLARLDKLLQGSPTHDPNRKLLGHLSNEREHLLTFLEQPGVQATNWRAEQAIRPAVVNRKHWGGNRTWHGADTQHVLMSVIRTARQQHADPIKLLSDLQRQPIPTVTTALKIPARASRQLPAGDTPQPARGP